jgi:hypothetical protein
MLIGYNKKNGENKVGFGESVQIIYQSKKSASCLNSLFLVTPNHNYYLYQKEEWAKPAVFFNKIMFLSYSEIKFLPLPHRFSICAYFDSILPNFSISLAFLWAKQLFLPYSHDD